jgi:hypothetical protein
MFVFAIVTEGDQRKRLEIQAWATPQRWRPPCWSLDVIRPTDGVASLNGGDVMSPAEHHALIERVRSEFLEMPGLRLTVLQAARLWGLDLTACRVVIDALVGATFLRWTRAGTVARFDG